MHSAWGSGHVVAGRYRLLHQLGRGAMGIVWRGRDELLDRDVAIKQIALPPMASEAEAQTSYQRTLREARTAARLSHPGVVTVFDVVEEDGMPWIVMELIKARPLDQVIAEDGPLPPAQAAQLGLSLLDALSTAHDAGVLHRDVKPSNVLISTEGKAILTDFGIATVQGDPGLTQAGMVAGTPGFSPPERVRGAEATPAADLWSLGATLYAAVEGRGPFDRAGGSAAIVASIATEPAPRAPSAGPLTTVIDLLLRADPAERPDAAATRRLLTTAWADARHGGYLGVGLRAFGQGAGPAGSAGQPPAGRSGLEATTATQVVTVSPDGAFPPAGSADGEAATGSGAADGDAGSGAAVAAGSGEAPPAPDADGSGMPEAAASDIVPDLMATPVFAELKMPAPSGNRTPAGQGRDGAGPKPGQPRAPRQPATGLAGLLHSRRGLVLTAPIAASALVAGIVFLAFPGYGDLLGQGSGQTPSASKLGSHHAPSVGSSGQQGSSAPGARSSAPPGSHRPSGGPGPARNHRVSGHPAPPVSTQSARPTPGSPSGGPSGTATPSPSVTPTPSPSASHSSPPPTGPKLPAGYSWERVTAKSIGTSAGFRLAAPGSWLLTPGLHSVIKPLLGNSKLMVDMASFAVAGPVREARRLQSAAVAHHRFRNYHLVSISRRTFHGWPAATWTFWWKPASGARIDVTKIVFTAQTAAGPQPYVLSMSAPAPHVGAADKVFTVAKRTFKPLPG
jgi:tRNA A-37 threonylcarbamoyl transferase component Bud32